MKKEELNKFAKAVSRLRTRLQMEPDSYELIAEGIERGLKEVMMQTFRQIRSAEQLPIKAEDIRQSIEHIRRETKLPPPEYLHYIDRLTTEIRKLVIPSGEQILQHLVLKEALGVLAEFVMEVEALTVEVAERKALEGKREKISREDLEAACESLGKWAGC